MSHPFRTTSTFEEDIAAGSREPGKAVETKTHSTFALFVEGENVSSLDVSLECSPSGDSWAEVTYSAPRQEDVFQIQTEDLNEDNAAYVASNSFAVELLRPVVREFSGDNLTVHLFLSGQTQRGVQFNRNLTVPSRE